MGKRELFFLLLMSCNFLVSVRRSFLFLCVLRKGCRLITLHGKRELFFLLLITCNFLVSVRRSFLFLCVLRKGCRLITLHGEERAVFSAIDYL